MFEAFRSAAVAHGATFDAGALTGAEAVEALCDLEVVARIVDGMRAQAMKRVQDTNAHAGTAYPDAAKFMANKLGRRVTEVRDTIHTASKLEDLPATSQAVREGRLTSAAARSIADAATLNPAAERELLAAADRGPTALSKAAIEARKAVESSEDRSERQRRSQYWKMWTDDDGMVAGKFRFTPEDGGIVEKMIEGLRQKLFRAHRAGKDHEPNDYYNAQAALSLLLGTADAKADVRVNIIVDHDALKRGDVFEGETCEIQGVGPVSVEWVRSILGEAFLTAIVKKGTDIRTVAHFGRNVPELVQTALIVGGHECGAEDCEIYGYLERDHMHDFALGGETSLENLIWLCYFHHRLKSRGWILGPPDPITGKRKLFPPNSQVA
jgi:hypothetical protein